MEMDTYELIGHLSNGEAVYATKSGCLAIEKDVKYLVETTPAEREEIWLKWPELNKTKSIKKDLFS
jgi:hypothetical protein